jgi:hypothetical protein
MARAGSQSRIGQSFDLFDVEISESISLRRIAFDAVQLAQALC